MNVNQYAGIALTRNWKRNLLLVLLITLILLIEMLCLCLSAASTRGEKEAFKHNGAAFKIDIDEYHSLTDEMRNAILDTDHVTGASCWTMFEMTAENLRRSEEHTGYDIPHSKYDQTDHFTVIADIDVRFSKWFWKEQCVSLSEGEYPSRENEGLLIESRVARENGLHCGDMITFHINDGSETYSAPICGIYTVDSDFEILGPEKYDYSNEDEFFDPYSYSPYNRIYMNYDTLASMTGEAVGKNRIIDVFIDSYESIDATAFQLKSLIGEGYALYDAGSKYLEDYGMLVMVKNIAQMMSVIVGVVGIILLLIILTYFAISFERECGLMLLLGQSRKTILMRYILLMAYIVLFASVLASISYCVIGSELLQQITEAANSYIIGVNDAESFYSTALYQPYRMTASIAEIVSSAGILPMVGIMVLLLVMTSLIPIRCVFRADPKQLLG